MGICALPYCDIFIYTMHGYFCERVQFDEKFWHEMLCRLKFFWLRCVAPNLLLGNFPTRKILPREETFGLDHDYCESGDADVATFLHQATAIVSATTDCVLTDPVLPLVRVCFVCSQDIESQEICSQCNICNVCCHLKCIGFEKECIACKNAVT